MKIKKLFAVAILAAAAAGICCTQAAFAAERTIYDETIDNVYSSSRLNVNWWGKLESNSAYVSGEQWASAWGSEGWYSDADDGSLAVHARVGSAVGKENSVERKVIADPLPPGSTIEYTVDFRTGEQPTKSGTEVWFTLLTEGNIKRNLFMFKSSPTDAPVSGFASTTNWPFTAKKFDRDPNNMTLGYGKDYTLKITVKPTALTYCKFVAELYSGGEKIATGLIEEWTGVTADIIRKITAVSVNSTVTVEAEETEPAVYIKHISIKGIYEDQKPAAELMPADESTGVALDTPCYMQFETAVKDISVSDVTVSGGAVVESVTMQDSGKKAIIGLSGLKGNTKYTVNVENVSETDSESAFSYSWSFTTGNATVFGKPFFGLAEQEFSQAMNNMDLSLVVQTDNSAYINGEAWAISDPSDFNTCYRVSEDGYLWARARLGKNQTDASILSHKFEPIQSGETLDVNVTLKLTNMASEQSEASIRIGDGSGNTYTLLRFNHLWNGLELSALTKNQQSGAWIGDNGTGTVILSRNWWHPDTEETGLGGDILLNLRVVPDEGGYMLKMTLKGTKEYTASKQITAEEAMALNTIAVYASSNNVNKEADFLAIKNVEIMKTSGNTKLGAGDNKLYINWENLDFSSPFNADVLIVERDGAGGYGTVKNVTIIRNGDVSGDRGMFECPFYLTDETSIVDVFVLESTDGGNLLSDKTSFTVGG